MLPSLNLKYGRKGQIIDQEDSLNILRINWDFMRPDEIPQELYLCSTEKIKPDDWFIPNINSGNPNWMQPKKCTSIENGDLHFEGGFNTEPKNCRKIIATTNPNMEVKSNMHSTWVSNLPGIHKSFIEFFVKEKGNVYFVNVDYIPGYEDWAGDDETGEPVWVDGHYKTNINEEVYITKIKTSYSKDEMLSFAFKAMVEMAKGNLSTGNEMEEYLARELPNI